MFGRRSPVPVPPIQSKPRQLPRPVAAPASSIQKPAKGFSSLFNQPNPNEPATPMKKGGKVRGGGCEQRGKTRGKFV